MSTVPETAEAGVDYVFAAGAIVLPAGTTSQIVPVEIVGDVLDELDETFRVLLSNPQHAELLDSEGLGTIRDDDEALVSIGDVEVTEGDESEETPERTAAVLTVELATPSDRQVRVDYQTVPESATAGADYETASGTLDFAPGETEKNVSVAVLGDLYLEAEEIFRVELDSTDTGVLDGIGVCRILVNEICAGPNQLQNPGAEEELGWSETDPQAPWSLGFGEPDPYEGEAYFVEGTPEPGGRCAR